MDDLITWLRAQLDDDERVAQAAGGLHFYDCDPSECVDHHERWDDERVLAEVDAKRRILDEHESYSGYGEHCQTCHRQDDLAGDPWPCSTVRLLALPYADRPGYREEWKP